MVSAAGKSFIRCLSDSTDMNYKTFHYEKQYINKAEIIDDVARLFKKAQNGMVLVNANSELSPSDTVIETGLTNHKEMKTSTQRLRWNLIFNVLFWILVPLPFWLPFISNRVAYFIIPSIQCVFVLMWTIIALLAFKNAVILYMNRYHNFSSFYTDKEDAPIRHIIHVCCYKEPIELIIETIRSIVNQSEVRRITVIVSFEERTPNVKEKCEKLNQLFSNCGLKGILFTVHPKGIPNEIPGKCSSSNFGLREGVKQMNIRPDETDNILITTCDADSKFPPQYIAALTYRYLREKKPALTTIYQSPLFYNWRLDALCCVTRVTGLLRSLLMLGALIPFSINTMSIFSYSLSLAVNGNFIHPAYQMDDIICLIRWMGKTQRRLRISMIPVPVLSGPTSGETVEKEIIEWARQARRWTIGAAEVFHYFIVKSRCMPFFAACSWGFCFLVYYGILLCSGGLYGLTSMLSMALIVKDVPPVINLIMYILFGLQMFSFLVAFLIDGFIPKLLHVQECIFILRNLFHFLCTPFILLAYSLVEFYALHELLIYGKQVCKHGASNKNDLHK